MAKKIDLTDSHINGETATVPVSPEMNFDTNIYSSPEGEIGGLSDAELSNPDNIMVTIADQNVPIVVLFGPTTCGKTMTLIRLTRYLQKYGYKVSPVRSFRPASDSHYTKMCDGYNEMVHSPNAAQGTQHISFMLVEVLDNNGRRVCQILEAPGEYYFNPKRPNQNFPSYIHSIINSNNRKIWIFMVEPDWMDQADRSAYVERIKKLKTNMRPHDKAVFLYNKVDKSPYVISPGNVNIPLIINDISNMYPGIFVPFTNMNPITRWFRQYNCSLVPFSNGAFTEGTTNEGDITLKFVQGVDEYPRILWHSIMKLIRG